MTPDRVYIDHFTELTNAQGRMLAFACYLDGTRWNGFASPHFTKPQADILMQAITLSGQVCGFDRRRNAYYVQLDTPKIAYDPDLPDDILSEYYEIYPPDSKPHAGQSETWGIGAWCWIWQNVPEDEAETFIDAEDIFPTVDGPAPQ